MLHLGQLRRRLSVLLNRGNFASELEEEMRAHIDMQAEENVQAGMDAKEAHYAAIRQFGSPTLLKERSSEVWSWGWLEALGQDIRLAGRMMRRSPVFTLGGVLTLALGLGANIAIFAILYDVALRPVRYPDAERLMDVHLILTEQRRGTIPMSWSYPKYEEVRRQSRSFEALAAYRARDFTLGAGDRPERVTGEIVTAPYFRITGIQATLGRVFTDEADLPEKTRPVILISDRLWRRSFAASPGVIGQAVRVNERAATIVGVLPPGFQGESGRADTWMPVVAVLLMNGPQGLTQRRAHNLQAIGLLKAGVNVDQANKEIRSLVSEMEREHPTDPSDEYKWSGGARLLKEAKVDPAMSRGIWILQGAALFVLLIACLNLASLLLGRSLARRREIAIRLALGVSRRALVRQLLVEPILLALLGGAAGLLLANQAMRFLMFMLPEAKRQVWYSYMRAIDPATLRIELPVLLFAVLVSLAAGIAFGLFPALRAARWHVNDVLKGGTAGRVPHLRFRNALVVGQIALTVILLAGAGLMLRSFQARWTADFGVETRNILTLEVALPGRYTRVSSRTFFEELKRAAAALPGVEEAAVSDTVPIQDQSTVTDVQIPGRKGSFYVGLHAVSPEFFRLYRIPLIEGRLFDHRDREGSPLALVINKTAAKRYFPAESAVGKHVDYPFSTSNSAEIVGVVGDVKYGPPEEPVIPDVYLSVSQHQSGGQLAVRTRGDPATLVDELRRQVVQLDREAPIYNVLTMKQLVDLATWRSRFSAVLLSFMSTLALLLAVIGTYGVFSYSVAARTPEIAVRVALGARRRDIVSMVLREAALLCAIALAVGVPSALTLTRQLSGLLYRVDPGDPLTFAVAVALLSAAAMLASYIPARRATKIDPLEALRHE